MKKKTSKASGKKKFVKKKTASKKTSAKKTRAKAPARKVAAKRPTKRATKVTAKAPVKPQMASKRRKKNEVGSDRSLRSSLTEDVVLAPRRDEGSLRAGQSGDLQGLSDTEEADSESVDELLEEGQALEAEVVEGVEDVPDEKPVPSRGRIEDDSVPDYDDREKL
jgi:hypothetical protein